MALPVALGTPAVTLRLMPAMEDYLGAHAVAKAAAAAAPAHAPIVLIEPPPPTLRFYSKRNLVLVDSLAGALAGWRAEDGRVYLAFRPARERDAVRAAGGSLEILLRTPALVLARTPGS
jgi:hypothetical protein